MRLSTGTTFINCAITIFPMVEEVIASTVFLPPLKKRVISSGLSGGGVASPVIAYSPPTPTSQYGESEGDLTDMEGDRATSPVPSFESIERPRSSPGILTTTLADKIAPSESISLNGQSLKLDLMTSNDSLMSGDDRGTGFTEGINQSEESLDLRDE